MHNCNRASCMRNNCTRPFSGFFNLGGAPGSYNAMGTTAYVSVHKYIMVIVARVVVSYPDSIHNGERVWSFSSYFSRLGNHATNKIARTYKSVNQPADILSQQARGVIVQPTDILSQQASGVIV